MKKKIMMIGMSVLTTLTATAQQEKIDSIDPYGWIEITSKLTDEQKMRLAGMEMQRYCKNYSTGMALNLSGGGLMVLGMYMAKNYTYVKTTTYRPNPWSDVVTTSEVKTNYLKRDGGYFLTLVGGIASLAGTIMVIEAPLHVKNAGLILSGNSIGLTIKL